MNSKEYALIKEVTFKYTMVLFYFDTEHRLFIALAYSLHRVVKPVLGSVCSFKFVLPKQAEILPVIVLVMLWYPGQGV